MTPQGLRVASLSSGAAANSGTDGTAGASGARMLSAWVGSSRLRKTARAHFAVCRTPDPRRPQRQANNPQTLVWLSFPSAMRPFYGTVAGHRPPSALPVGRGEISEPRKPHRRVPGDAVVSSSKASTCISVWPACARPADLRRHWRGYGDLATRAEHAPNCDCGAGARSA